MFAVRGVETVAIFHCASTSPNLLVLPLHRRLNKSEENTQGKSIFFSLFHQQFMMEHCSTYSPPPQPPTVRWLNSIKASPLRCLQSRCRLKPRFPSTRELKIEGMIGSHLIISGYTNLTGRSLSFMTNEQNIYINTPRSV